MYHLPFVVRSQVPHLPLLVDVVPQQLENYSFLQPFLQGDSVTEAEVILQFKGCLVTDAEVEVVQSAVHLRIRYVHKVHTIIVISY